MAYNIATGDILECRVVCWEPNDNQLGLNVMHYLAGAPTGPVTLGQAAVTLDGIIKAAYKAWLGNPAQYRGVGFTKIWPLPRTIEENTNASAGNGTGGANLAAQQASGLIQFRTGLAGHKGRGRIYPPFPPTAIQDADGNLTAGGATLVTAIGTAIGGGFTATGGGNNVGLTLCVYNRATHAATPITSFIVRQKFATQRRRGQYGRTNILPF